MGWNPFSSKKVTKVGTSVMRVVDDRDLPETVKQSVIRYVLGKDKDLSNELMNGLLGGSVPKMNRMFNYAKDNHPLGLPDATIISDQDGEASVKTVIESEAGEAVEIVYYHFGTMSSTHFARKELAENYGYNPATNEVTHESQAVGYSVFVKDIVVIYTPTSFDLAQENRLTEQGGSPGASGVSPSQPLNDIVGGWVSHTDYEIDEEAAADYVRIILEWKTENGFETKLLEFNFEMDALEDAYFQVLYRPVSQSNDFRYWTYDSNSNVYPFLNRVQDPEFTANGNYFPFVFFRSEKVNLSSTNLEDTDLHKSHSKMMDMIGIDYVDMGKSINDNPDIDDVEQAVLWMGVPLVSDDPIEIKYLHKFFRNAYFMREGVSGNKAIYIRDKDFKVSISFSKLTFDRKAGVVDKVDEANAVETYRTEREVFYRTMTGSDGSGPVGTKGTRTLYIKQKIFKYQISESHYEEILIEEPSIKYIIWKGKSVTGDIDDERFLIPLDKSIGDTFSMPDREVLYARSLHFVFNSRVTIKVKWYEQKWFRNLLIIAAVVMTIYSIGTTWEAVVAAYAVGGVIAVLTTIAIDLAIRYAISEAAKLFVKEVGAEAALWFAIAMAAYTGGKSLQHGSLQGAPWASELLQVSTSITGAIQSHIEDLMGELKDDYSIFNTEKENALKDLSQAKELLNTNDLVDPMSYVEMAPLYVAGESPDDYYNRTVHLGSVSTIAIDSISNYVETALQLPEINESVGA